MTALAAVAAALLLIGGLVFALRQDALARGRDQTRADHVEKELEDAAAFDEGQEARRRVPLAERVRRLRERLRASG